MYMLRENVDLGAGNPVDLRPLLCVFENIDLIWFAIFSSCLEECSTKEKHARLPGGDIQCAI